MENVEHQLINDRLCNNTRAAEEKGRKRSEHITGDESEFMWKHGHLLLYDSFDQNESKKGLREQRDCAAGHC